MRRGEAGRTSELIGVGALVVAVLLVALVTSPTRLPGAEVGAATEQRGEGASRVTEEVVYRDDDLELLGVHLVADRAVVGPEPAVWATATHVLPAWALAEIRQLNLVTDGRNGTLAMVHRSALDTDGWILSLDPAEETAVLEETLVHELAHMLTLRRDDLTAGTGDCDGVRVELGCARAGSALAEWSTEFWPDGATPGYDRTLFASEYASTAVHEDLAESFLRHVIGPPPASGTVLARKVAFFDEHPALAAAATDLRTRIHTA